MIRSSIAIRIQRGNMKLRMCGYSDSGEQGIGVHAMEMSLSHHRMRLDAIKYYRIPSNTATAASITPIPCNHQHLIAHPSIPLLSRPSRLKHLLVVSIFVPSLHSNKHPNLRSQILILHQRTLESLSPVTSVFLDEYDQNNQYQYSNSHHRTHNYKRHYPSAITLSPTHRPQSQNIVLPNALRIFIVSLWCLWFLSICHSTSQQAYTQHDSNLTHLSNLRFCRAEWIELSTTMLPLH